MDGVILLLMDGVYFFDFVEKVGKDVNGVFFLFGVLGMVFGVDGKFLEVFIV